MRASNFNIPLKVSEEQFTIVILTYNRPDALLKSLKLYASMSKVAKIVILWNNENLQPPDFKKLVLTQKPIVLKRHKNRLSTRFEPLEEVDTQAVVIVDDDMVFGQPDLYHAFEVWKVRIEVMLNLYSSQEDRHC